MVAKNGNISETVKKGDVIATERCDIMSVE